MAFVIGAAMNVGFQFGKHSYVHADEMADNTLNKDDREVDQQAVPR
jgi:hypothetical protein